MKLKKITLLFFGLGAAFIVFKSDSNGKGGGDYTGSPQSSNTTCAASGCHTGTAVSATNVNIIVQDMITSVPVNQYVPGTTYNVYVAYSGLATTPAIGFQSTAYKGVTNVHAGTFAAGTGSQIKSTYYATHTGPASATVTGTIYSWTYSWTAPSASTGNVNFYAACNFANGDTDITGDKIYTGTTTLTEKPNAVNDINKLDATITLSPNPTQDQLNVSVSGNTSGVSTYSIVDLFGKKIMSTTSSNQSAQLSTSALNAGSYFLVVTNNGKTGLSSFIKN